LVSVSGSIAAYKMAEVVRGLTKNGASVRVVMTPSALQFVAPATFAALSGHPVHTDVFDQPERVVHVELGRWADAMLIGAATASTIERLASGNGEDIVSAAYLMCRRPVVLAPAMHTEMWEHPAVQRNVARLLDDGVLLVPPGEGLLASGDAGVGRLAEPADIVDAVRAALAPKDLAGVRMLVTAGPTQEPLDPVRYISNRSSGRMGYEIATEAVHRGAHVTLVSGPSHLAPPPGAEIVRVTTAQEMLDECLARFDAVDVVVKAAAVADWRPAHASPAKLKKGEAPESIELERTADIAAELGRKKSGQILVAFAAETGDVVSYGRDKLVRKNADLVVANLVGIQGSGFESDTNDAALITAGGVEQLPRLPKRELARRILDRVVEVLGSR
jgi:phosphopantothenoylcysteine decarboxylase/phosphopantothenate--cysteine ligase